MNEETQTPLPTSPLPKSPQPVEADYSMDFPQAIKEVINGKKITREEWENKNIYGFLNKDILSLHKEDNINYQWIINDGDLIADDWKVIN
jgi:hypothetical protein